MRSPPRGIQDVDKTHVVTVNSKALGAIKLIGQPLRLSRTPTAMVSGAPDYAEQADEILAEFGYGKAEIEAFHKNGAV